MKHHGITVGSIISINVLTFGPPLELDNDMVWKKGYIITSLIKHAKRDDFTQQKKTKKDEHTHETSWGNRWINYKYKCLDLWSSLRA